ncbi:COG4280 domain-containing protein [Leifsonia sp. NPDC056824]|uniref:COG4280 domain-containing protein n=1 Tax=Leifsonia sp. NPDC056824 TaxID=3345953 RepID=UPI00369A977D
MNSLALFVAVFLACLVEAVEATTIVLAAGATRNWRSALTGTVVGVLVLAVIVAVVGPAVTLIPLGVLRLVVGGLLLVFGLQWVRKAVLRASGYKALHDETLIYQREVEEARTARKDSRFGVSDWYAFTLSFKAVLLEGLEVVFIVLTFGANQQQIGLASLAAAAAIVVVVLIGVAVRAPLSRVPENTLKFVVGVMLTSFGVFWGAEGAGAVWPGADLALLVLIPAVAVYALLLVAVLRRRRAAGSREASAAPVPVLVTASVDAHGHETEAAGAAPAPASPSRRQSAVVRGLRSFGMFWWDFIVGDDWQIAAGAAVGLAITFAVSGWVGAWVVMPLAVLILIPYGIRRALR